MVFLNMQTNENSTIIANFESVYNETYIKFQNFNQNKKTIFAAGVLNNTFKIFDIILEGDEGFVYNNNTLTVRNTNTQFIGSSQYAIFPNLYTDITDYYIGSLYGNTVLNYEHIKCFDLDNETSWRSPNIYSITSAPSTNGTIQNQGYKNTYNFLNLDQLYGDLIIIKFPYPIIPRGFSIDSVNTVNDPKDLTIYLLNITSISEISNITNLSSIKSNSYINIATTFNLINNQDDNFYNTIIIIITKVNTFGIPISQTSTYVKIASLKIYSEPILTIGNNIRITNDNISGIKSLNVEKLYINNLELGNIGDITDVAISQAIGSLATQYSFFWKVIDATKVAYINSSIVEKIALGNITNIIADATLDIYGDICYNKKIIKNYITVLNTFDAAHEVYNSSYILIGTLSSLTLTDNFITYYNTSYFNLKFYSYDIDTYYFQTINIYGSTYKNPLTPNVIPQFYWNTSYDFKTTDPVTFQRIVDIKYIYNNSLSQITLYAVFNDNLNIIRNGILENKPYPLFKNVIFFDEFHTKYNKNILFVFPLQAVSLGIEGIDQTTIKTAKLISLINLNGNIKYTSNNDIKNLTCDNIKFSKEIIKNNVLITNSNSEIVETNITSNILAGLKIISYVSDSLVATDSNGILKSLNIPNSLLYSLCNLVQPINSNKIITTSENGLTFNTIAYNPNILNSLNNITTNINSILVINSNGNLTTTNTLSYNTFNNLEETLKLFSFSNEQQKPVTINSNIILKTIYTSNIFIGNTNFTSNINTGRIFFNNSELAEDIFKNISKIPIQSEFVNTITENISGIFNYTLNYTDGTYTSSITINSDIYNNTTNFINLLKKDINNNWISLNNYTESGDPEGYITIPNTTINNIGNYFILTLSEKIILTNYILYVNYSNIENTIREFSIYGYNNTTNTYDILQTNSNVNLKNYFIPNNFFINKNNTNIYNTYLFAIRKTNNTSGLKKCILGSIELFGYKLNNINNISYNTLNNTVILGNSNVGIKNLNPKAPLSIGADLYSNTKQSLINLNHDFFNNGIESPIINIARTSINTPSIGAIHYINNLDTSNTNYTIKLMHNFYNNEKTILSMNSDGRIGIGSNPIYNHSNNGLSIFNNGISLYNNTSNYINFQLNSSFSNSYNLVLPNSNGLTNDAMFINNIVDNKLFLTWKNPLAIFTQQPFIKLGNNTSVNTRNEQNLVLQVAGSCLIGSNVNTINSTYLQNNTLIVSGNIYSTSDISSDSDIAYKYNIELIKNPLEKIHSLNGYIFNRNDTNDDAKYTGLIAQEVLKVMPEVIIKKHDGKLRVIYANLVGLLIEGIKKVNNNYTFLNTKINFSFILIFYLMYLNAKNGIFY